MMPQTIAERFGGLRTPENRHFFDALAEHFSPPSDHPCLPMWFNYAITANERGRTATELLGRHVDLRGKHYLDVGCAFGGFLVAFAERGARVAGIDINEKLLRLAASNLRDNGLDAPLLLRDATRAEDLAEFRGRVDVVTCNDVIEHVLDPAATIVNIASVLRPGGVAYFEVPNRNFPRFVIEDGHYLLFGITLLERPEAERYYLLENPADVYTVGHYLELEQYARLFEQAGMRLTVLDETFQYADSAKVLSDIAELRDSSATRLRNVPEQLRDSVAIKLGQYLTRVGEAHATVAQQHDFMLRYGVSFWKVLGRKMV